MKTDLYTQNANMLKSILVDERCMQNVSELLSIDELAFVRDLMQTAIEQREKKDLLLKGIQVLESMGLTISDYMKPENAPLLGIDNGFDKGTVLDGISEEVDKELLNIDIDQPIIVSKQIKEDKADNTDTEGKKSGSKKQYVVYEKSDHRVSYMLRPLQGVQPREIRLFLERSELNINDIVCTRAEAIESQNLNQLPYRIKQKAKSVD